MSNVRVEHHDMAPALFKWSDFIVSAKKIPESGAKLFCISEDLPGRNGSVCAWSIVVVLEKTIETELVSKGWAKFLFNEAPDVDSLIDHDFKIFDGPKHIADVIFKQK